MTAITAAFSFALLLTVPGTAQTSTTASGQTAAPKPLVNSQTSNTAELKTEIAQLKKEVEELKKATKDLKASLDWVTPTVIQHMNDIDDLKHSSVTLDPALPEKYARVETDVGLLLIKIEKVEPYLDGYKLELGIANPHLMTFKGLEVSATWAPRLAAYGGKYSEWLQKNRTQKFSLTDDLLPGRWNSISLILPATKPEDFGYLRFSLDTNIISLGAALSK